MGMNNGMPLSPGDIDNPLLEARSQRERAVDDVGARAVGLEGMFHLDYDAVKVQEGKGN